MGNPGAVMAVAGFPLLAKALRRWQDLITGSAEDMVPPAAVQAGCRIARLVQDLECNPQDDPVGAAGTAGRGLAAVASAG